MHNKKEFEEEQNWIFTFGSGQKNAGHYVKIYGTFNSARKEMFRRYNSNWSFQYSEQNWKANVAKFCSMGTELKQ